MLALQTAFTSAAGLLIGLAGVLAYTGRTRPELLAGLVGASALCAVLYLLAAIIGAAASSTVVTSKNPLEIAKSAFLFHRNPAVIAGFFPGFFRLKGAWDRVNAPLLPEVVPVKGNRRPVRILKFLLRLKRLP